MKAFLLSPALSSLLRREEREKTPDVSRGYGAQCAHAVRGILSSIRWRRDVLCVGKDFFMGVIHRV
jgi:hypothetical protein